MFILRKMLKIRDLIFLISCRIELNFIRIRIENAHSYFRPVLKGGGCTHSKGYI